MTEHPSIDPRLTFEQRIFLHSYNEIQRLLRELRGRASQLPRYRVRHFDRDGQPCGWEELDDELHVLCAEGRVITTGLEQYCFYEGEANVASTDGWDDMGDMDGPAWISCQGCGQDFGIPQDMEWD